MIEKIKSIFTIPELRSRIIFTLSVLIVVRIGAHIPIPGVDGEILALAFDNLKSGLFGLFNTFVGGAFSQASLFSLGIMPYISSSIIIQLMGSVIPYFQRLQKEGEAGRKKITQITRYGTVLLASMQSLWCGCCFFTKSNIKWSTSCDKPRINVYFYWDYLVWLPVHYFLCGSVNVLQKEV